MTIAITGANGHLGRLAIAELKKRSPGAAVIGLVRDPAKAGDLGVPLRSADYLKPETLGPALAGVKVLVLISSSSMEDRAGQHRNVIAAAKAAGVERIVYTSILKGDASPLALAPDHAATEAALKASGLPTTLLRNGWYIENFTGSLGAAIGAGAMIGSAGAAKFSAAARADYAAAIAVVATTAGHEGKVYELAGDVAFTMADVAAEVSRRIGKTIPYNSLPEEVYSGILKGFGLPEGFANALAQCDAAAQTGALFDDSHTLSRLIGRPTTAMADVVAEALAAL